MQQEGIKPLNPVDDMRKAFNAALFIAFVIGVPVQVWLRRKGTLGKKYISYHFLLGVVAIVLWGEFAPPQEFYMFLIFAGLTSLGILLHTFYRKKGMHSQYVGDSICGSGPNAKTKWELLLTFCIGVCFMPISQGLGAYIIASGVGSSFFHSWVEDRDNARLRAMRDAEIEQGYFMERFKNERQDW